MTRNKETQLKLFLPDDLSSAERADVAERVIEFIKERSKSGYNVFGRDWSGKAGEYTDAYAKKKGVSEGGPVDLALSHDMLDGIERISSAPGEIVVGYKKGTDLEQQAEGNILGTYGQKRPIPGKARPFLDILQKDLKAIIDEVKSERG